MARRGPLIHDPSDYRAGERNGNWKGGRSVASNGYVLVKNPGHPEADVRGYVYEHRMVAAEHLGRPLRDDEQVHHRNRDKTDNRWENLEVLSPAEHAVHHRKRADLRMPDEPNPSIPCGCGCGSSFLKFDGVGRPRRFVSGHNTRVRGNGR